MSPHKKNTLVNTKESDIVKVKHMCSFLGLYKTLQIATPAMARILAPLKDSIKDKQSADNYIWDQAASLRFREAKSHIANIHTLYLPHPKDQLVLKPDASSTVPGVGHTLYAVKDSKLVPVRFHSAKLPQQCLK